MNSEQQPSQRRKIILIIACAIILFDAAYFIANLAGQGYFVTAADAPGKLKLTLWGVAHVVAWTILPPTWFFIETFTLDEHLLPKGDRAKNIDLKADYERLRLAQDLAGKIWAAVLVTILFLVPK